MSVRGRQIDKNTLGGRLRSARQSMRYTIEQAAELLDISVTYLGIIERNVRRPSVELLLKINLSYSISLDYLLLGNNEYPSSNAIYENCSQRSILNKLNDGQFEIVMQIAAIISCGNFTKRHLDILLSQFTLLADFIKNQKCK